MEKDLLLIPDKPDKERDRLAEAWEDRGGTVKRIGKFWIKPEVDNYKVSLYGYDSFCLVLAQVLELNLAMPKDEDVAKVSPPYLKRNIEILTISAIDQITFPKFIKPVTPKLFKAAIFESATDLKIQIEDIAPKEHIMCSDIIVIEKELRSFILDNQIQDLAYYEGTGELAAPKAFIESFLATTTLEFPNTFVLDLGYNEEDGWFIIEFNSCWGAGLNGCAPEKVLDCIRAASFN